jgi:hypothetical protein
MIPIYLRFSDEAEALAALTQDESPRWQSAILQWVSVPVSRATGEVDADGVAVFERVEGYHVNVLWDGVAEITSLMPYRAYPATPSVVWAGISEG